MGDSFYFKPDAGQIFVSPADATPSLPLDAYPDDLDVALGIDRFERATTLDVRRVSRAWAGLRTFASDGSPVVGPDPEDASFFWLAGQGGYGLKTSPARSRACAALVRREPLPDDLLRLGVGRAGPVAVPTAIRTSAPQQQRGFMTIQRFDNGPRFCRVLSHNGTVYLAGMTADDTGGDTIAQTRAVLAKIDHYLALAGSDRSKLLTP